MRERDSLTPEFLNRLIRIVDEDNVLTSQEDLRAYSYDGSSLWTHMPDVVVFPVNTEQVSQILKLANDNKIPVTARGGGTNVSGGSIPVEGGICLCMTKMNRIIEINKTNLNATVEPGLILGEFYDALAQKGLFFPPDPSSFYGCTMGGVVAENSGGPSCLKYGVTKQYILALEVVLADGRIVNLGGLTPKNRTGYELAILFAGSEGTLGIITKIVLRVLPSAKATKSILVGFRHVEIAGDTVSDVIDSGILPCRIEFCGSPKFRELLPADVRGETETLLLFQTDGLPGTVEIESQQILDICRKNGAVYTLLAENAAEEEKLWEIRRGGYADVHKLAPTILNEDVCVPRDKITEFIHKLGEIGKKHDVRFGFGGHAGDGNFHPGVPTDKNDPDHYKRALKCVDEIIDTALSLGGVLSGEHGIGLEKKRYFNKAIDPVALEIMKKIKNILDPNNILNPGKIWDEATDNI